MAAALIVDWERGVNQTTAGSANLQTRRAAEKLSVSERSVFSAKRIREHGAPELIEAIRAGAVKVHTGAALSELQHTEQARVVREGKKAVMAMAKEIRAEQQEVKRAVRTARMIHIAERGRRPLPRSWANDTRSITRIHRGNMTYGPKKVAGTAARKTIIRQWKQMRLLRCFTSSASLILNFPASCFYGAQMRDSDRRVFEFWKNAVSNMSITGSGTRYIRATATGALTAMSFADWPARRCCSAATRHAATNSPPGAEGQALCQACIFAETIERLWPDLPKLELFCRSPRPGWDAWGYEAAGTEQ